MRKVTVSVQVDAEKLRAIQFYAGRKQSSIWKTALMWTEYSVRALRREMTG